MRVLRGKSCAVDPRDGGPNDKAARARGVVLGRQVGQRPSDKKVKKVLALRGEGLSYRLIGRNLGLSKNTVMDIVRRAEA